MQTITKVDAVSFHRNGVGGAPFYSVRFTSRDGADMLALVFEEPGVLGVVSRSNPEIHWRGDMFEAELREIVLRSWDGGALDSDVLNELSPNGEAYR